MSLTATQNEPTQASWIETPAVPLALTCTVHSDRILTPRSRYKYARCKSLFYIPSDRKYNSRTNGKGNSDQFLRF